MIVIFISILHHVGSGESRSTFTGHVPRLAQEEEAEEDL